MFSNLDRLKPGLKQLVAALRQTYPYASVLAVADDSRSWRISRSGTSISTAGMGGGSGFVVRVFDHTGCAEYSFNEFSEAHIPDICATLAERLREQAEALGDIAPLPTPLPGDEPAEHREATGCRRHPADMGDEAILKELDAIRKNAMAIDGRVLDVQVGASYRSFRKLFLSENRDLDQTVTYMTAMVSAVAARGQEMKSAFRAFGSLGGAEVLQQAGEGAGEAVRAALDLLESEPIPPGEYECICDPGTTGMIVHEAFGHGVEMDMFVKDRAQAKHFVDKQVASELVTMHDGAVEQTAFQFFDDEGTLTGDTVIIDKGILRRGMCDALSAGRLGAAPTGNGRRESFERKAYTRMTNTYFEAGESTLEEMIASVDYGFLLENAASGMEDPKNWGIQCMVTMAREIRDGKLTGKVYSPIVLTGYVPDLLKSVSMMGRKMEISGSGSCGKGAKEWVKVTDGGPYMKARISLG